MRHWSAKCGSGPGTLELPGNLSKMQTLGLNPRYTESEIGGMCPKVCILTSPPDNSDTH